ncbi:hypothetical protein [Ferviditalea candida]|uniref:Uncharacterized protein n=1 Tax=Ferviditalea candida TaxID=3108399 RepID=A0ABU5ZJ48_9BACL|nr:hypothetical protein [Paenibacillaceae bacterium T2]
MRRLPRPSSVVVLSTVKSPFARELFIEGFAIIGQVPCCSKFLSVGQPVQQSRKCLIRNGYVLRSSWSNVLVFSTIRLRRTPRSSRICS